MHLRPAAVALPAALALLAAALSTTPGRGADWPQFLGPRRDGSSPETLDTSWPANGPRTLWSRAVGTGFSGPVVVGGRVLLHHRQGDETLLECLPADAGGGEPRWTHRAPTTYRDRFGFDPGPRATPCVDAGRVFTFGADGLLEALDLESGRLLWQVPTATRFQADQGFFGFASSPLVVDDLVLLAVGGRPDAGIVAFEAATGKVRWKATGHEAGYASPVLARLDGEARALFFTREGLVVLEPRTGNVRAEFPWRSPQNASVNAATPLVIGPRVLLSASYDTGATLLDLSGGTPRPVWSGDDRISAHYASLVHHQGLVFGFHGRQESGPTLRCLDAATGAVRWSRDGLGSGSLLLAGDQLVVLTERGELLVAPPSGEAFRPTSRAQVLGTGIRAVPALADGRLYARDKSKLVALDLRPAPSR